MEPQNKSSKWLYIIIGLLVAIVLFTNGAKIESIIIGGFGFKFTNKETENPTASNTKVEPESNIPTQAQSTTVLIPTNTPPVIPVQNNPIIDESLFEKLNVGTGIFISANSSDGNRDYDSNTYYKIQRIRYEEVSNGCDISNWSSQLIWVTGNKGTNILLNNETIGQLTIDTGNHGYLVEVKINPGDQICISGKNPNGFSVIFGPDTYYHYDSYCYRGFCK